MDELVERSLTNDVEAGPVEEEEAGPVEEEEPLVSRADSRMKENTQNKTPQLIAQQRKRKPHT